MRSTRQLPAASRIWITMALVATALVGAPLSASATSPCGTAPDGADSMSVVTVSGVSGTVCEVTWTDPSSHVWVPPTGVSAVDFLAVGGGGAGGYFYFWAVGLNTYTTYNGAAGGGGGGGQVAMTSVTEVPDGGFWVQPGYGGETATVLWYFAGNGHDGYPSEVRRVGDNQTLLTAAGGLAGSQGYPWAASYNPPKGIDGTGGAYTASVDFPVPGVSDATGGISASDSGTYPPSNGQDATYWGAGGGAGAGGAGANGAGTNGDASGGAGGAGLADLETTNLFNGASLAIGGGGGGAAFSVEGEAAPGAVVAGGGVGASRSSGATTNASAGVDGTGGGGGGGLIATGSSHQAGGLAPGYGGTGKILARYLLPGSTPTPTQTPTPSETPTPSDTPTPTPSETPTPTPSETPTPSDTPTPTPSDTPTPSETPTPTPTPTESPTPTPTPTPTDPTPSARSVKATVYFAGNSAKLTRAAKSTLAGAYAVASESVVTGAKVVGTVNTRRFSAVTKKLATARAKAVVGYLRELGLDVRVHAAVGKGVKGAKSRKATIEIFFSARR